MNRTRMIPGHYNDAEIAIIEANAAKLGLEPQVYVRKRLQLPQVKRGRPAVKLNDGNSLSKRQK